MGDFSKNMQRAQDAVRAVSPEHQDLLAVELMEHARFLAQPPATLTVDEQAELAAAWRGEFASEAEVAAMYAQHGL